MHTLALKPMTKADLQKRLNKGVYIWYGLVLSDMCVGFTVTIVAELIVRIFNSIMIVQFSSV